MVEPECIVAVIECIVAEIGHIVAEIEHIELIEKLLQNIVMELVLGGGPPCPHASREMREMRGIREIREMREMMNLPTNCD